MTNMDTKDERRDYTIENAYYSIKTQHGRKNLNSNGDEMMAVELNLLHEPDAMDEKTIDFHIRASDGGVMEGMCFADLSLEDARDLQERLGKAIEAYENDERYTEQ